MTLAEVAESIELFIEDRQRAHRVAVEDEAVDVALAVAVELSDLEYLLALTKA